MWKGETMSFREFLLRKEIKIKNYTGKNLWNVMEFNPEEGEIIIFFFNSKKERDSFLKEE